ncbi:MAG: GntR family transcriptional regulator [Spirochaetales bacterium]|nr:GntR family transcriptional regulator [Spirochaetales bacterium]
MNYSFTDDRPIFQQLAEYLKEDIMNGVYQEGSPIPSSTQLSVELKINPATTMKAVNLLVEEGLVEKKRGIGMFVRTGAREEVIMMKRKTFMKDHIRPLVKAALSLRITEEELTHMVMGGFNEN